MATRLLTLGCAVLLAGCASRSGPSAAMPHLARFSDVDQGCESLAPVPDVRVIKGEVIVRGQFQIWNMGPRLQPVFRMSQNSLYLLIHTVGSGALATPELRCFEAVITGLSAGYRYDLAVAVQDNEKDERPRVLVRREVTVR